MPPDNFILVLDTEGPSVSSEINGGAETTPQSIVYLTLTTSDDAYEMKVWGSIDPTDPANGNYGEDESGAVWLPIDWSFPVRMTPGDGPKLLHVRIRDDVNNESEVVTASITRVGTDVVPPAVVTPRPAAPIRRPVFIRPPAVKTTRSIVRALARHSVRESRTAVAGSRAVVFTRWRFEQNVGVRTFGEVMAEVAVHANSTGTETAIALTSEGEVSERISEGPRHEEELVALAVL